MPSTQTIDRQPSPTISRRDLMASYEDWAVTRIQGGWEGTLLTILFKPLAGSSRAVAARMEDGVHGAYRKILPFALRCPAKTPLDQFPLWLASADWPVPKRVRTAVAGLTANEGRHIHVVAMMPPNTRMKTSLEDHVRDHQDALADRTGPILRIHAATISRTPRQAVGYSLKSLTRHRIGEGDILILPKVHGEMSTNAANATEHDSDRAGRAF